MHEPSGDAPGVNVSGQGMQVGTGNIQNNTWMTKPPLDPVAMSGRNPHTAVTLLRQVSHDELVDFFIRASPGDVSEILEVFAEVDLPKVVATLGDISRRKLTQLIGAIDENQCPATLDDLPKAAEAIAREAARLGWTDAGSLEFFMEGYARNYPNGRIFWHETFGVVKTSGAINDYWAEGRTDWSFPVKNPEKASSFGTIGVRQEFQPSPVYWSEHGVFRMVDEMCYQNEGGSGGWLGFPVSEREHIGRFGDRQMFEGGAIYSYVVEGPEGLRSFAVRREVVAALPDSRTWRPVSKEVATVSSYGWRGTVQHFEIELEFGTCETAVYSPNEWQHGPKMVTPGVWEYYSGLGAEKSSLGFPVTGEYGRYLNVGRQDFEGGMIYWRSGSDPICVRKAVAEFITQGRSIGYPMTEEHSVNSGESDSIQFFERGVVTMRDGKYEVWRRPAPEPTVGVGEPAEDDPVRDDPGPDSTPSFGPLKPESQPFTGNYRGGKHK